MYSLFDFFGKIIKIIGIRYTEKVSQCLEKGLQTSTWYFKKERLARFIFFVTKLKQFFLEMLQGFRGYIAYIFILV